MRRGTSGDVGFIRCRRGTLMRRRIAGAVCAVTVAALVVLPAHAQADPASRALEYLHVQQLADGSIPAGPFGGYSPTEYYVIAAADNGFDPAALTHGGVSAVAYLQSHATDAASTTARAGLLTLAVEAAGSDASSFGGVNVTDIITSSYSSGTGAYDDGSTYTQSLAVLGLRSAGQTPPAAAYAYLASLQDSDGGWNYSSTANDPAGSDTNSTALALMALRGDVASVATHAAGVTWLQAQQEPDGGFGAQLAWGTDADSTALVIQALGAGSVSDSAYTSLLAQQEPGGGFGYQGAPADTYTASQAALGLVREPLGAATAFTAATSAATSDARAVHAIGYLESTQMPDGGLPSLFSSGSDLGSTCDLVMGAAASGVDPSTLSNGGATAMAYLRAQTSDAIASGNAGRIGKLTLAAIAGGANPATFGGGNLTTALASLYAPATGSFGDGSTAAQSYAILAQRASGAPPPAGAVTHLANLQDSDGGWNYTAATDAATGSDTNSTALALMALDATGHHGNDATALAYLRTQQDTTGAFAYQIAWGGDVDSTALVIQALVAAHQDPGSVSWAASGVTPVMYLSANQDASGGFGYGGGSPDPFTTSQIPSALMRAPFPVHIAYTTGTTVTPAPTATPTPAPSVTGGIITPVTSVHEPQATSQVTTPLTGDLPSPSPASSPSVTDNPAPPTSGVLGITTPPTTPVAVLAVEQTVWPWYALGGAGCAAAAALFVLLRGRRSV